MLTLSCNFIINKIFNFNLYYEYTLVSRAFLEIKFKQSYQHKAKIYQKFELVTTINLI